MKPLIVGVDIGGSHITAAIIDLDKQCVVKKSRVRNHVDTFGEKNAILTCWGETIKSLIDFFPEHEIALCIAMPGPFDYANGVSLIKGMNKYEALYGVEVKKFLCEYLQLNMENIFFWNDAYAFLKGELFAGSARGYERALGITLGTGLGSAVGIYGEVQDANLGVSTFKQGIAEDYISTRWFIKRYHELSGKNAKDTKELAARYNMDHHATILFNEFARNLADFLTPVILQYHPEVVIIGGNIARAHSLFLSKSQVILNRRGIHAILKITSLWEDAAMIGVGCSELKPTIPTSYTKT